MTRKEQIYATIETFLEDNDIGKMTFPRELSSELTDRMAALPLDVPGDDEIKEWAEDNYTGKIKLPEVIAFYSADWMRSEIIKRNRP